MRDKLEDFDDVSVSSITSYQDGDGSSRGDIDGGVVNIGSFPTPPDGITFADYDVAPDGRFLLFPSQNDVSSNVRIARVVVNWFSELTRLAPPR